MKIYKGAFIITFGIIISRALSLLFIFPFSSLVGASGLTLYSHAYVPFNMLLDVTTLGIPQALTKLTVRDEKNKNIIFYTSLFVIVILSILSFIFMNAFAYTYLKTIDMSNINDSIKALRIISLSLLAVPISNLLRGYIGSFNKFKEIAISQILEQVIRVVIILSSCYITIKLFNNDYKIAIYLAILSTFISSLINNIYLFFIYRHYKCNKPIISYNYIKIILKEAFLFFLIAFSLSSFNFIDSLVFNKCLRLYGIEDTGYYYGVYEFEIKKLIMIPIALSTGFGVSLLPNINRKNKKMIVNSLTIVFLLLLAVSLYINIYSYNIYSLLFKNVDIGPSILKSMSIIIIPYSIYQLLAIIMHALNKKKELIISIILSLIIKLIVIYPFTIRLGINGLILSTFIPLASFIILNIYNLNGYKIDYFENILIGVTSASLALIFISLFKTNNINPIYIISRAFMFLTTYLLIYLLVRFLIFNIKYE